MKQNRRGFLLGLGAVIVAPAAVKTIPAGLSALEAEGLYGIGSMMRALPGWNAQSLAAMAAFNPEALGWVTLKPGTILSIDMSASEAGE